MLRNLLWLCAIAAGAVLLLRPDAHRIATMPPAQETAATYAESHPEPAGNGLAATEIVRAPDGHFYADAQVNGAHLRLMVDTGSTSVALTRADAQAAGVQIAPGDFTAAGQGAGGAVRLKRVTLDRVAIGPVAATGVDAVVAEDGLPVSLIGQSFLARVARIEIAGDKMTLR